MKRFTYDMYDHIEKVTAVLSTVWHKHLGIIPNIPDGIRYVLNMNTFDEISFDVYKELDGKVCELWNQIVDFKYVYIPEHETYYEIYVSIDDTNTSVKHITGKSTGETELSNRKLRDLHINDEIDINYKAPTIVPYEYDMDDSTLLPGQLEPYKATIFYRPIYDSDSPELIAKKKRCSLMHRVLADKCPDWDIGDVAPTIARLQRTFTTDNTSVYDFLTGTVGKEMGCLFTFDTVNRKINVSDLYNICDECGYRGTFTEECPKCGSTSFHSGYGKNTRIFLSSANFATNITLSGNTDNVKNCLHMSAGDDLMSATVANINPNGSRYIYHFSKAMYDDMPEELVDKLIEYNKLSDFYADEYEELTEQWYDWQEEILRLRETMMPDTPIPGDTTATAQLVLLERIFVTQSQPVAVQDITSVQASTATNAVIDYAKTLVDPRYTVESYEKTYVVTNGTHKEWRGRIRVVALGTSDDSEDPDEAISEDHVVVQLNDDYERFLKQKIDKSLDRTDATFQTIFKIKNINQFKKELKNYSLNRLLSFKNTYDSICEILIKMGVTETNKDFYGVDLYNHLYEPYYQRGLLTQQEADVRDAEVRAAEAESDKVEARRKEIRDILNFANFLGEDLFKIFSLYRREGEYSNPNYISDGLDTPDLIARAREFYDVAAEEVKKASQLELNINETLNNLLNLKEFKDYKDGFDIGDWLVTEVDEEIYVLRLTSVECDEKSPESISFSFSNVDRPNTLSDSLESILNRTQSISSSYNFVAHQAAQGDEANDNVTNMQENGVDASTYNVLAGANGRVQIDEHGIILKDYDDDKKEDYPEQLKIINNMISFTKDNWATVEAAIGKIKYLLNDKEYESYGVNAQTLIAGLMIAGDIYSKNWKQEKVGDNIYSTGTHIDLNNGSFIIGGEGSSGNGIEYDANKHMIRLGKNVVVSNGKGTLDTDVVSVEDYVNKQDKLTPRKSMEIVSQPVYDSKTGALIKTINYLDAKPVEITQAEYDALPDTEKNDGVIRYITDIPNDGHYYGTTKPDDNIGYDGDIYIWYGGGAIEKVYGKILGKWLAFPTGGSGGSYIRQKPITEGVYSNSTITVRGGVT